MLMTISPLARAGSRMDTHTHNTLSVLLRVQAGQARVTGNIPFLKRYAS